MPTLWLVLLACVIVTSLAGIAWAAACELISLQRIHAQDKRDTLDRFLARSPMDLIAFPPAPIEPPGPDPDEALLNAAVKRFEQGVEDGSGIGLQSLT